MQNIPLVNLKSQYLKIKNEMDQAIFDVIDQTAFINGQAVQDFENQFAKLYKANYCVPVANGTDAIYIVLKKLGIKDGDEVITTANSWISSSETITQVGAKPVFVDINPDFYTIDENKIEAAISKNTKAIIPVHIQGQSCEMGSIMALAKKYNLHIIEDCAQAHFTEYYEQHVGLFGDASTFSFFPGKNLGAYGDAGGILTNNERLALNCKMFARHGALKKHEHEIEGINSRLDTIQAAILNVKLPYILEWTSKRIENASLYNKYLADVKEIVCPKVRPNTKHSFHLYVIRTKKREKLALYLKEKGIETAVHYPVALPNMKAYQYLNYKPTDFPIATAYQELMLSLPMCPELNEEQIVYIANCIKQFFAIES
ncbi:MAG: DegT/DnrJ/EryC1/StrS family aminotransferase [Chitinophagaceae bacterium]